MKDLVDKQVNRVLEIEKNCQTQIESIKKENAKFSKTIMDEILHTSEKIEELKITIRTLNNRLEESHVPDRSRNTPDDSLEYVKSCLISQEEKQNVTDVKLDELSSVMAQVQEDMRLLVNQVDLIKRESKSIQSKQESDQNQRKLDELRQRQEPTEKYEKDEEIQKEISVLKCKIEGQSDSQTKSMVAKNKDGDANELKTKLANLESADVFLQETIRLGMEKTASLEKTINDLRKGNSSIEKDQENSINTVDPLKRDISTEKLRVNSLELFIKNRQEKKLDENSEVETRIEILDEGYSTILKEMIEHITNELKNKEHEVNSFNLTNYKDIFSKTESHEAKQETLEKNITDLQTISSSAQQLPTPGLPGQIKTEQMEFISKKIEEQKRTLEMFVKSIEEKIKKLETIYSQEVDKFECIYFS